jgi:hypothetical protein
MREPIHRTKFLTVPVTGTTADTTRRVSPNEF